MFWWWFGEMWASLAELKAVAAKKNFERDFFSLPSSFFLLEWGGQGLWEKGSPPLRLAQGGASLFSPPGAAGSRDPGGGRREGKGGKRASPDMSLPPSPPFLSPSPFPPKGGGRARPSWIGVFFWNHPHVNATQPLLKT